MDKRRVNYTKKAVLALLLANEKEFGFAYGKANDKIPDKIIDKINEEYHNLFRGKKWSTIVLAFFNNRIANVEAGTSLFNFAKQNNLKTTGKVWPQRSRKKSEIEKGLNTALSNHAYRDIIFPKRHVDEALIVFARQNDGHAPLSNSGLVKNCILSDGILTWADISEAFPFRVEGIADKLSMQVYAMQELGLHTIHNPKIKKKPPSKSSIEGNNNKGTSSLEDDPLKKASLEKNPRSPQHQIKVAPLNLRAVFRVTALATLKDQGLGARQLKLSEQLPIDSFKAKISFNLPYNPLIAHNYTWQQMIVEAQAGQIPDLPVNFDLARFAQNVSERFKQSNYTCPTPQEVQQWMITEAPKAQAS